MFSLMTDHFSYTDKVKRKLSEVSGRTNGEQENVPSNKVIISKMGSEAGPGRFVQLLTSRFPKHKEEKGFQYPWRIIQTEQ